MPSLSGKSGTRSIGKSQKEDQEGNCSIQICAILLTPASSFDQTHSLLQSFKGQEQFSSDDG
jgi:hypothetical protein